MRAAGRAGGGGGDAAAQAIIGEAAAVAGAGDADRPVLGVPAIGVCVVLKQIAVGVVAERGVAGGCHCVRRGRRHARRAGWRRDAGDIAHGMVVTNID